jgi:hypothetical protein
MTLEMRKTKKRTLEMREEDKEEDIVDERKTKKRTLEREEDKHSRITHLRS